MTIYKLLLGAANFRDLGGIRATNNKVVAEKRIFRSERFDTITDSDIRVLKRLNLKTIVDLRSESERKLSPNPSCFGSGVDLLNLNVLTDVRSAQGSLFDPLRTDPSPMGAMQVMRDIYEGMPAAFVSYIPMIFERIAYFQLPLVIHCSAGKDRTGFLSVILLSVLGVNEKEYIEDYLKTEKYIDKNKWRRSIENLLKGQLGFIPSQEVVDIILGVREEYIKFAIEKINNNFGGMDGYIFEACKVSPQMVVKVKEALLV